MLKQKRRTAWTVPMMLQAALLSSSPLLASEQQSDEQVLVVSTVDEVQDVVVKANPTDDDDDDSKVPNPPVLKSRTIKARPTKAEPSDVRETEVIRKKEGTAITGGRFTLKSADGRSFEIVTPDGAMHVVEGKLAPGKPVGVGRISRSFARPTAITSSRSTRPMR